MAHGHPFDMLISATLLGIGIGLAFAALGNLIVQAVPAAQTGVATGMNTVMRTLGGALGGQLAATFIVDHQANGLPTVTGFDEAFLTATAFLIVCVLAGAAHPRSPARGRVGAARGTARGTARRHSRRGLTRPPAGHRPSLHPEHVWRAPPGLPRLALSARGEERMAKAKPTNSEATGPQEPAKLSRKRFEKELLRLQRELVIMQEYVRAKGLKIVVIFEGRDAAGKGGVIKRITERTSPRICRVVALPAPTEREKTQWYFQRYVAHLPAAGEIVLFDRSWYNRAGVERVMGFCTEAEYQEFMRSCPEFEHMLLRSGIQLIKYWFSVSDEEQERRFQARVHDPMRRWKLSPMDLESRARWVAYSRAKDEMFRYTDIKIAPWYVVQADDKRRARLNCIAHLLSMVQYEDLTPPPLELPPRD